ncbi:MAG: hypothetical protein D6706_16010 [Chloroflexi bacterium]|nr:MAG: hypothetical protein D6706_16010 [Chloroflexota bacterium]
MIKWVCWILIVAGSLLGWEWYYGRGIAVQPIQFNHAKHDGMGCNICHSGVPTKVQAELPSLSLCMNCHAVPPVKDKEAVALWDKAKDAPDTAPWESLYQVPEHVYFSHRTHLANWERTGITCSVCHGDIHKSSAPPHQALVGFSMNACITCHNDVAGYCKSCDKAGTELKPSTDCVACHR